MANVGTSNMTVFKCSTIREVVTTPVVVSAATHGPKLSLMVKYISAAKSMPGVIAAFLAKGMDAPEAAAAGAVAHGIAASLAPAQPGLIASDVVAALPQALT